MHCLNKQSNGEILRHPWLRIDQQVLPQYNYIQDYVRKQRKGSSIWNIICTYIIFHNNL